MKLFCLNLNSKVEDKREHRVKLIRRRVNATKDADAQLRLQRIKKREPGAFFSTQVTIDDIVVQILAKLYSSRTSKLAAPA